MIEGLTATAVIAPPYKSIRLNAKISANGPTPDDQASSGMRFRSVRTRIPAAGLTNVKVRASK
ncbi:MAG: hypothetical protein E5X73_27485 [Mesorhizobium sp.]|nr:MAG: hypothetical protein E5X73_27485 [Mesorhizobium sp.]